MKIIILFKTIYFLFFLLFPPCFSKEIFGIFTVEYTKPVNKTQYLTLQKLAKELTEHTKAMKELCSSKALGSHTLQSIEKLNVHAIEFQNQYMKDFEESRDSDLAKLKLSENIDREKQSIEEFLEKAPVENGYKKIPVSMFSKLELTSDREAFLGLIGFYRSTLEDFHKLTDCKSLYLVISTTGKINNLVSKNIEIDSEITSKNTMYDLSKITSRTRAWIQEYWKLLSDNCFNLNKKENTAECVNNNSKNIDLLKNIENCEKIQLVDQAKALEASVVEAAYERNSSVIKNLNELKTSFNLSKVTTSLCLSGKFKTEALKLINNIDFGLKITSYIILNI